MRTIIAGSRTILDRKLVYEILDALDFEISETICGCARGIDTMGTQWAKKKGIPTKHFPANWDKYGKKAGILRNIEMAKNADVLVLIHRNTPGSLHMLSEAKKKNLTIYEFDLSKQETLF